MKILHRVFGKFVGVFIAPTKNVEFLGVVCEKSVFVDLVAPMLLFADLDARQYGTSYGTYYTMTDAVTFVAPAIIADVAPADVVAPAGTGKKRGRKSWQALEVAF